mgnify:CR=1 FL=1
MEAVRDQLVQTFEHQAVVEVQKALATQYTRLEGRAKRRVLLTYIFLVGLVVLYYSVTLLWSSIDLKRSRGEYLTVCETYTGRESCVRLFEALNKLDNTFAIGASWWWLMDLVWPLGFLVVVYTGLGRLTSLTTLIWAVWSLLDVAPLQ